VPPRCASVPAAAEAATPAAWPVTAGEFAACMTRLGPFGAAPALAVAVSGGADSMALALLADAWARARGGRVIALIVDHGLRPESAAEARLTAARLAARAIPAQIIRLDNLARGPGLAARARTARYAALAAACAALGQDGAGVVHLLLGHHQGDQAETLLMRAGAGSGPAGLAGMAPWRAAGSVVLLRPLLALPPERLRASLRAAGMGWVEDPSNADPRALRTRLRRAVASPARRAGLSAAAAERAAARRALAGRIAAILAERALVHPAGFALLSPGPIAPAALAALIQTLAGRAYPPPAAGLAALAAAPRAATLAGVRLLPAGRLGVARFRGGWLLVREAAALAAPVTARPGTLWDGRFRLLALPTGFPAMTLGALGAAGPPLRRASAWPAAVLGSLPALRAEAGSGTLIVPHLGYPDPAAAAAFAVIFTPPRPLAGQE